ncbi:MAG: hypothetical protein JSU75_06220 [Gammaproteobacteria bacterium]|nr:MAG: hypothetical protein JSU75_06220 [Gammaproteobacteria bacterium]
MRLPEFAYRSVPGIIIVLGVTALYIASETYYLVHAPLYTNLVVISGLLLVLDGILMTWLRKTNAAHQRNNLLRD